MKSYAERTIFHEVAQSIWADAVRLVDRVSDRHGNEVRCHELARAALSALCASNQSMLEACDVALSIVDGNLWAIEHTWLLYQWNSELVPKRFILDVYCPGRLPQVQLIDGSHFAIARGYEPGPVRTDIDHEMLATLLAEMTRR